MSIIDDIYAVIILGYPQPLEKQFADRWPVGEFVRVDPCDHDHMGPCSGEHWSTTTQPSRATLLGEGEVGPMMARLARIKHVTFEAVVFRRHVPGK